MCFGCWAGLVGSGAGLWAASKCLEMPRNGPSACQTLSRENELLEPFSRPEHSCFRPPLSFVECVFGAHSCQIFLFIRGRRVPRNASKCLEMPRNASECVGGFEGPKPILADRLLKFCSSVTNQSKSCENCWITWKLPAAETKCLW